MRVVVELLVTAGIGWFVGRIVGMFFLPPGVPGAKEADTGTREAYAEIVGQLWFQRGIRKGAAAAGMASALVVRILLLLFFKA